MHLSKERILCLPLRTWCFIIGWYDIVYGHAMVLVYLATMYTGYFHAKGIYRLALWIDFTFTIVQLLEGAVLVYGVKYKTIGLVMLCAVVGVVLMAADVVGDVLLALSFPDISLEEKFMSATALLAFIGVRGCMTVCVYSYYEKLKEERFLKNKINKTIPDIITSTQIT